MPKVNTRQTGLLMFLTQHAVCDFSTPLAARGLEVCSAH